MIVTRPTFLAVCDLCLHEEVVESAAAHPPGWMMAVFKTRSGTPIALYACNRLVCSLPSPCAAALRKLHAQLSA